MTPEPPDAADGPPLGSPGPCPTSGSPTSGSPTPDSPTSDSPALDPAGLAVRREVLGDAHVDRALAGTDEVTAEFQAFITRYAWGGVWTRPGLDRRERSIVTLSVLAALHHDGELGMHVRGARRNGLSVAEIREVLLQVGIYAGVPAANRAFAVAQRVLAEMEEGSDGEELGRGDRADTR